MSDVFILGSQDSETARKLKPSTLTAEFSNPVPGNPTQRRGEASVVLRALESKQRQLDADLS